MPDAHGPLLLLDTASLYFRAFYGVPNRFHAADGTPVNAVRGMLDFITRLAGTRAPSGMVAAWDNDWRPSFRVRLLPSYKAHRVAVDGAEEVPQELTPQVPIIAELLPALGVPVIGLDGYEADDVIGTLAGQYGGPVEVVTGDRDLFQLVNDRVRVLYTARGVSKLDVVDDAWLRARYGVGGAQYADYATLRGDASDGLPGVRGIGEKTAAALIATHGHLAAIRAATDLKPALAKAIADAADYLDNAPRVVAVRGDLPLQLPLPAPDPALAAAIAARSGLAAAVSRAQRALA